MSPQTLVVLPTYNERQTVRKVVEQVLDAVAADILVVDDSSPDGTGDIVDDMATGNERLRAMHRATKQGLGGAYRAGFSWGLARGYQIFVEMDADLSHDPGRLPALIEATSRADLVIGSRYVPGGRTENWPWYRRLLSWGGNRYVQAVTGVPVRDATSGFRALRRELLEELRVASLTSDGYSFQLETALRAWRSGFRVDEVPITFVERRAGASKISRAIVFEAMWRVAVWGVRGPRRAGRPHPRSVVSTTS